VMANESEQAQHLRLMQSISYNSASKIEEERRQLDNDQLMKSMGVNNNHDDESIYDEFAEYVFEGWVQKIWDVTGHLWYHEESLAFLEPVTREVLGDYIDYYLSVIDYPMDLTTIKEKIKAGDYLSIEHWRNDIDTMFKNCMTFNEEESDIHQSALKLKRFYNKELRDYGLIDQGSVIRII
jgi:Bromodomain